jgi:hypothetical protein
MQTVDNCDTTGLGTVLTSLPKGDGFIAWRSAKGVSQPEASLRDALKRVLHPEAAFGP